METLSTQPFQFLSLSDIGITEAVAESGNTYEENAILKAEFFGKKLGLPTIADDSGIHVDALHRELGVHTRRWGAGEKATEQEWLDYFLQRMATETNRSAEFVSVIALYMPNQPTVTFRGICRGTLLMVPPVPLQRGVPLSSLFVPDGESRVFSALTLPEKSRISHRGQAIGKCCDYLSMLYTNSTAGATDLDQRIDVEAAQLE